MNSFNSMRRDLLRVGSLGMAGAAIPAVSFAAASSAADSNPAAAPGLGVLFNVHNYGASRRRQNPRHRRHQSRH